MFPLMLRLASTTGNIPIHGFEIVLCVFFLARGLAG